MEIRKMKAMLFGFMSVFALGGCSSEGVQGEKEPLEIHNVFIMFEEEYLGENEESIGDLYLVTEGKEKEKIASGVLDGNYSYINNQNKVLFINEENELYEYEVGKEKTKLAEDVIRFNGDYSEDFITFQDKEEDLYILNGENEEEKIASTVAQYELIDQYIYYVDDDGDFSMYNIEDQQETEIDSDVVYFTNLSEKEVAYLDDDYSLYYKNNDDESIRITSDEVSTKSIKKIGSDLIYYNMEDESSMDLYSSPISKAGTAQKIASDVKEYQFFNDFYYYVDNDDNLYKKKESDTKSTKLASDVMTFKLKKGTLFYTNDDDELFKIEDDKTSKKMASSILDYDLTPDGDVVYTTEDMNLFVNDKKIASEIEMFYQYYGNVAFSSNDDKLYLLEDMEEKKVIEDNLNQFSNASYQNKLVFTNELSFEDIAGVWEAKEEGESAFFEIDTDGTFTYLLTGESRQLEENYAGYHSLHAISEEQDIEFVLGEEHTMTMNFNDTAITLSKATKADADKYVKALQMEADQEEISILMDDYITSFQYAVNYGDESYITDYIAPESSLYQTQVDFVLSSYKKDIKESLEDYEIESINSAGEGVYTVNANETFTIYTGENYEGTTKNFKNTYTVKEVDGKFLITDIKVSQTDVGSL